MTRKEIVSWFERAAAMDPGAPSMEIPMRFVHAAYRTFQSDEHEINEICEQRNNIEYERDEARDAVARFEAQACDAALKLSTQVELITKLRHLTTSLEKNAAGWKSKKENTQLREELKKAQRIAKMSVVEKCRVLHIQDCSNCTQLDCCDNTSHARHDRDELIGALKVAEGKVSRLSHLKMGFDTEIARLEKERREGEDLEVARMRINVERVEAERDDMRRQLDAEIKERMRLIRWRDEHTTNPTSETEQAPSNLQRVAELREALHKQTIEITKVREEKGNLQRVFEETMKETTRRVADLRDALYKRDAVIKKLQEGKAELRKQKRREGEDLEVARMRINVERVEAECERWKHVAERYYALVGAIPEYNVMFGKEGGTTKSITNHLKTECDTLRKQRNNARNECADSNRELKMANKRIVALNEKALWRDAEIKKLHKEVLVNKEDCVNCSHVAELREQREFAYKQLDIVKAERGTLQGVREQRDAEITLLRTEGSSIVAERDKLRKQRNVAHAENDRLRKQLHHVNLATEGSSIVAERDALRQELEEASTKELRALKVLAAMHEAERDKLKAELDKASIEELSLVALNEVYKKEIAELKKELGETRDCLSELVDDIDDYDIPMDSFTTRPARELLKGVPKQIDSCEETDHEKTLETLKRCAEEGLAEDQVAWNKAMSEVVRIPDMAKGLHSTTPLSTHGAGRDEMDHLKKAKPEETERTRKERAQLMREHYSRVARLADKANPHMMAAIDAWEKLPDLEKYLWKAEIDRDAAETERDRLKKALKPLNQQVEEYGIALQKARQERQAALCDRDNKTIELMEHKRELTEELMREFLTTLEPFALMHRFFAEEDDKHVLSFSEAAKITVGDLKRAKELRDKHFVNEESVPLDPDARTLTGQIEYGRGLADILLKKDFEIERLKKASKPLDKDDHKDEFLEVLKPFAGLYIPKSLLNDVGVCAVGDVKVTIDDIRKARELYDKHNVDEEETDHEKT